MWKGLKSEGCGENLSVNEKNAIFAAIFSKPYGIVIDYTEFKTFFEQNYGKFYSFAFQLIGDGETCRDIVSDAFEIVWRNRERPDISNLSSFIYSYIRNQAVNYLRHEKVKAKHAELCRRMYVDSSTGGIGDIDERIRVMNAIIGDMTEQTRTVFRMCYIDKMKYKEVAQALDISTNTVQKHIVKALKLLRNGLKNID